MGAVGKPPKCARATRPVSPKKESCRCRQHFLPPFAPSSAVRECLFGYYFLMLRYRRWIFCCAVTWMDILRATGAGFLLRYCLDGYISLGCSRFFPSSLRFADDPRSDLFRCCRELSGDGPDGLAIRVYRGLISLARSSSIHTPIFVRLLTASERGVSKSKY